MSRNYDLKPFTYEAIDETERSCFQSFQSSKDRVERKATSWADVKKAAKLAEEYIDKWLSERAYEQRLEESLSKETL